MPSMRRGGHRSARKRTAVTAWVGLLKLLLVLVSFQLTGLDTLVTQAALCAGDIGEACDDCPAEDDGEQCPPDCPSCHCVHRNIALPASIAAVQVHAFEVLVDATPLPMKQVFPTLRRCRACTGRRAHDSDTRSGSAHAANVRARP